MSDENKQLSQSETIILLQKTIEQLNGIVSKLQTESLETLPSKTSIEGLVRETQRLAASLDKDISSEDTFSEETDEEITGLDRVLPSFNSLQTWWDGLLGKTRAVLPTSVNNKLSDWALTGIITGIVVVVLLTSVLLFPQQRFPEVAQNPPETTEVPKAEKTPTVFPLPEVIETPSELTSPGTPEPIEITTPEPELTPEQSLIAAIQEQLREITSQYPEGLIKSIQANFLGSRLIVTVGDGWYELNPSKQDSLANTILKRSQKLDFRKLEIIDNQGSLLARNPVVGNKMVIFSLKF
jgi:hypothetical protein